MTRGPVVRSDYIGEQLPGSLVTLMRLDLAAHNHAAVEGKPAPYRSPARERSHTKADPALPVGGGTPIAIPGHNRNTARGRDRGTTPPKSGTTAGVEYE